MPKYVPYGAKHKMKSYKIAKDLLNFVKVAEIRRIWSHWRATHFLKMLNICNKRLFHCIGWRLRYPIERIWTIPFSRSLHTEDWCWLAGRIRYFYLTSVRAYRHKDSNINIERAWLQCMLLPTCHRQNPTGFYLV